MGCVIDHLQVDHRVTVIQDFTDVRGIRRKAGESAILRSMDLDWLRQEIVIVWERDGVKETLTFALAAKEGPRNGRMRDYFSVGERVPLFEDTIEGRRQAEAKTWQVPEVVEEPVTDTGRYGDAVDRVWALAARRRFEEAETQVKLILSAPDPCDGRLQSLAGDMVGMAVAHARDADSTVYDWAREKAVHLWYAWGSGATSGGEGTVRRQEIRAAEERLARCDAERR
jgi:hypothetical protein